jgi:phospholipid/cholesterol/gamma-HCH transport system ATP-binding protein
VAENLALPLCYHQNCVPTAAQPRVQGVLEMMELQDIAASAPASLTRNLRQRVAFARALVLSPEVLFLDDPLAGIDPRESRWWLEFVDGLLKGHPILERRALTLVVGTDNLAPWGDRGRQFGFISEGRFTAVGSRADLLRAPNPALRELLPVAWLKE